MVDKRDETTWATLELTRAGELRAIEGKLAQSIRSLLAVDDTFQVFIPYASYTKGGRTISIRLIEGYAFVMTGLPEVRYFALERSPLVGKVFSARSSRGLRVLHTLPNSEVDAMRKRLAESLSSDLEVGSRVRVTGGNYRDLEGVVVDVYDKAVAVQVEFRSLTTITILPLNIVTPVTEDPTPMSKEQESELDQVSLEELIEGGHLQ